MNILTYTSPVSINPHWIWCIGLCKGSMLHKNFVHKQRGVLQLLRPEHAATVGAGGELMRALGGSSGRDVDKGGIYKGLGHAWERLPAGGEEDANGGGGGNWLEVLASCLYYLKLRLVGDLIDCGSHDAALCKVVAMLSSEGAIRGAELDPLSTRGLRQDSITSEFGRIIPLP